MPALPVTGQRQAGVLSRLRLLRPDHRAGAPGRQACRRLTVPGVGGNFDGGYRFS